MGDGVRVNLAVIRGRVAVGAVVSLLVRVLITVGVTTMVGVAISTGAKGVPSAPTGVTAAASSAVCHCPPFGKDSM